MKAHASLSKAQETVLAIQQTHHQRSITSRKGFLVSLEDIIGPPPALSWREELEARVELMYLKEVLEEKMQFAVTWASSYASRSPRNIPSACPARNTIVAATGRAG